MYMLITNLVITLPLTCFLLYSVSSLHFSSLPFPTTSPFPLPSLTLSPLLFAIFPFSFPHLLSPSLLFSPVSSPHFHSCHSPSSPPPPSQMSMWPAFICPPLMLT